MIMTYQYIAIFVIYFFAIKNKDKEANVFASLLKINNTNIGQIQ